MLSSASSGVYGMTTRCSFDLAYGWTGWAGPGLGVIQNALVIGMRQIGNRSSWGGFHGKRYTRVWTFAAVF